MVKKTPLRNVNTSITYPITNPITNPIINPITDPIGPLQTQLPKLEFLAHAFDPYLICDETFGV